jgi:YesN/AraC family two-component response regulator
MKKLLIVDDQQEIREMLELVFKFAGFRKFFTAENGEKAIDIAKKEKPDLILMDVKMPGKIDGMEAT